MIRELNKPQRRWLAVAILLLVITGMLGITVLPAWIAGSSNRTTIASMESRLERLRQAATISDGLRSQYEQLSRWHESNTQYLKSGSTELAAAELQRLVKRLAVESGANITSTQILTVKQNGNNTPVVLKVRMTGELEEISRLFHALESNQPYLFLDNVVLKSRNTRRLGRRRNTTAPKNLNVDFDITGYIQSKL